MAMTRSHSSHPYSESVYFAFVLLACAVVCFNRL
jgi:hypothetical protein